MNKKEIAKFLSGFVAHEALMHTLLAGSGLLPLTTFGITLTPEYNALVVIFWWVATFGLIYFAWLKK
ncbi:hypothetical protein KBD08_02850 [Candidatus Babeliales bacterium]|nr:hypothetical protein [Candidatus Babeliales bacterium]